MPRTITVKPTNRTAHVGGREITTTETVPYDKHVARAIKYKDLEVVEEKKETKPSTTTKVTETKPTTKAVETKESV